MPSPTRPVLYMDFDGTLAFKGSVSAYPRRSGHLGYLATNDLPLPGEPARNLHWSGELVQKMRRLPADWLWLSSWDAYAVSHLDVLLHVRSVGYLPWLNGGDELQTGKWSALVEDQRRKPRPFVWCDDAATAAYDPVELPVQVPHLVLTPDPQVGLARTDLTAIQSFLASGVGADH